MALEENIHNTVKAISLDSLEDDGDIVDPWNVQSKSQTGVDYDKLLGMC